MKQHPTLVYVSDSTTDGNGSNWALTWEHYFSSATLAMQAHSWDRSVTSLRTEVLV